ncbi:MAG: hypothetical protein IKK29_03530, partial [Christensenellaceae bacterium]|nr:hypothetical protein [Christensenellaceae bacterium]
EVTNGKNHKAQKAAAEKTPNILCFYFEKLRIFNGNKGKDYQYGKSQPYPRDIDRAKTDGAEVVDEYAHRAPQNARNKDIYSSQSSFFHSM